MSDFASNFTPAPSAATILPNFDGILSRRLVAWLMDLLIVTVLSALLAVCFAITGLITFGLGWHLFALLPVVPFLYSFGCLASPAAATLGQQVCGLRVVHHVLARRPTPLEAFVSTVVFLLSLAVFPLLPLMALFTARKRTLQDIVAGLLMIRTTPLTPSLSAWTNRTGA